MRSFDFSRIALPAIFICGILFYFFCTADYSYMFFACGIGTVTKDGFAEPPRQVRTGKINSRCGFEGAQGAGGYGRTARELIFLEKIVSITFVGQGMARVYITKNGAMCDQDSRASTMSFRVVARCK